MSHFAELNKNNEVLRVLVCDNNDPAGDEGYQWLIDNLEGTWIKTSYNGKIRGNFAGVGMVYLPLEDIFVFPKCHDEAILNAKAAKWECTNTDHKIKEIANA
jgi:hypothetical protein